MYTSILQNTYFDIFQVAGIQISSFNVHREMNVYQSMTCVTGYHNVKMAVMKTHPSVQVSYQFNPI